MTVSSRRWTYREKSRGRPRGRSNLYEDFLDSIISMAIKYYLDPKRLIEAFIEARSNDVSHCGSLKVACRDVNQDSAIFLITKGEDVVSQFPIKFDVLENHIQIPIPGYVKKEIKKATEHPFMKIRDLRFRMRGIGVKAKVIEIPQVKHIITRYGTSASISNILIADETGSVRLSLWNNSIDRVRVGDSVELKTCNVARFLGELQLRLGRKGIILVVNDEDEGVPITEK